MDFQKTNFERTKMFMENLFICGLIAIPRDLLKIKDEHLKIKIFMSEKNMVQNLGIGFSFLWSFFTYKKLIIVLF